jgi:hypothetical protein
MRNTCYGRYFERERTGAPALLHWLEHAELRAQLWRREHAEVLAHWLEHAGALAQMWRREHAELRAQLW